MACSPCNPILFYFEEIRKIEWPGPPTRPILELLVQLKSHKENFLLVQFLVQVSHLVLVIFGNIFPWYLFWFCLLHFPVMRNMHSPNLGWQEENWDHGNLELVKELGTTNSIQRKFAQKSQGRSETICQRLETSNPLKKDFTKDFAIIRGY